jgi:hypothetical protein
VAYTQGADRAENKPRGEAKVHLVDTTGAAAERGFQMPIKRRRRQFLTTLTLGGAAGFVCPGDAWPAAPHAKLPGDRPLVAWFSGLSRESAAPLVGAFRDGLQELGYSDGMDLELSMALVTAARRSYLCRSHALS